MFLSSPTPTRAQIGHFDAPGPRPQGPKRTLPCPWFSISGVSNIDSYIENQLSMHMFEIVCFAHGVPNAILCARNVCRCPFLLAASRGELTLPQLPAGLQGPSGAGFGPLGTYFSPRNTPDFNLETLQPRSQKTNLVFQNGADKANQC